MWQKLVCSMLLVFLIPTLAIATTQGHLARLKAKFPYGLLGDDQGVLTVADLAVNACSAIPKAFDVNQAADSPYEYWQCFASKTISPECDSMGVDEYEGLMGLIVVNARMGQERHQYLEHRGWPIKECRRFVRDLKVLLKGTKYACISGSFIDKEALHASLSSWQFEKIKTKKGCEGRNCELTARMRKETCPTLKF